MQFASKQELYDRVRPALSAKVVEFRRRGNTYIKEIDIWNYLSFADWQKAHELMLSDIVSDIMHVNIEEVDNYLKGIN